MEDIGDLADLLGVHTYQLIHVLYEIPECKRYKTFSIKKAGGGDRQIAAPGPFLVELQRKLAGVLQDLYGGRGMAHGFSPGKSIATNADLHIGQRWVLNLDLKDFFHDIHFGRVRGLLMASPYKLPPKVAGHVAALCCYQRRLPQGAPTSPVLSNMICSRLDAELRELAKSHRSFYTRYADDITFSTSKSSFPRELAYKDDLGQLHLGVGVTGVLTENNFKLNKSKLRLQHRSERQEVTGLIVNKTRNVPRRHVRQIRAMLHAWRKFGYDKAEKEYHANYDKRSRWPGADQPRFRDVVLGKLEYLRMVRPLGSRDPVYRRYRDQLLRLEPGLRRPDDDTGPVPLVIVTEGKTDVKHLRAALRRLQVEGEFINLALDFHDDESTMGEGELLKFCESIARRPQKDRHVCVFDRDVTKTMKKVTDGNQDFKHWNNNVYSLALPVPVHRENEPEISIELLYTDDDIKTADAEGRRLYLSDEFDSHSWRLKADPFISIKQAVKDGEKKIIDQRVVDGCGNSLALTKDAFAEYVEKSEEGFDDFDVSGFRPTFEALDVIARL